MESFKDISCPVIFYVLKYKLGNFLPQQAADKYHVNGGIRMDRRKRIALFAAYPELTHVRRVIEGVMGQCKKYDYDLCVFAPSVHLSFPHENYVRGEANIYELANFSELDGVIIDSDTLSGDKDGRTVKKLLERLAKHKNIPVCALELPLDGIKLIKSDNEEALREECRHVIEVHGRKKICILTGPKDNSVAEQRLAVYLDEIKKHGLEVQPEHIIYGDFYYFSGDGLAKKIAAGEISMPDAVICASDCMAMALVDRLTKLGVRVPEDIVVVGFDSSDEGAINPVTISSYEPSDKEMGANAVDYIRSVTEPGAELMPFEVNTQAQFHTGASCGCQTDPAYAMKSFRKTLYVSSFNLTDEEQTETVGLGAFMESYALEGFTASKTAEECIGNIYQYGALLKPYRNFYLCLKENWLNMDDVVYEGYPENMKIYVASSNVGEESFCGEENALSFAAKEMLPYLDRDRKEPSVFYFSPVHFDGQLLGYAVLEREMCTQPTLNVIYRNWLRYINNALEMTRSKERLQTMSVRDAMTGAYNRRGMYTKYKEMLAQAKEDDALFVGVVDMDGLKYVNDTFGHKEGDFGIMTICEALMSMAKPGEICVRSGGDEFFIIGIGTYKSEDEAERSKTFSEVVAKKSEKAAKPYNISASIGCIVFEDCRSISLDVALSEADERMYNYKVRNRRHRSV